MDLSLAQPMTNSAVLSMDRFVDLCVASAACTNSVNYIFRKNSCKMYANYYKIKKTALLFYAKSISLSVIVTYLLLLLHPSPTFQLASQYLLI